MKKEKKPNKKLTPKEREEKKQHIKKLIWGFVHVVSYILSFLFLIVCVIAACQGGCSSKKKSTANNHNSNDQTSSIVNRLITRDSQPFKDEDLDRYFYPSDVQNAPHILHLNFSNYNYLKYFLPNYYDLTHYSDLINSNISNSGKIATFQLSTWDSESQTYIGGIIYNGDKVGDSLIVHYNDEYYNIDIYYEDDNENGYFFNLFMFYDDDDFILFDSDGGTFEDVFGYSSYDIFDFVFTSDLVRASLLRNASKLQIDISLFTWFYLSQNSFDYNAYMFAGPDKYVSFVSMFRRVYNGFFLYYPNHDAMIYNFPIFKGVWEYKNTIYDTISIRVRRAWNGNNVSSYEGSASIYNYSVYYYPPIDNLLWFTDIFSGDSPALTNYYFIDSIYMTSVDGSDVVTLAYNRFSWTETTHSSANTDYVIKCYPSENIRLWNDDSFLNNRNIEFVLYSIKYDYTFNINTQLFVQYKYYSDFFFNAFYYTGLYHTTKPTTTDETTIFAPIFLMLSGALVGILPLLNANLLPGVSIGAILLLPFVVSIILFVVKLFKR